MTTNSTLTVLVPCLVNTLLRKGVLLQLAHFLLHLSSLPHQALSRVSPFFDYPARLSVRLHSFAYFSFRTQKRDPILYYFSPWAFPTDIHLFDSLVEFHVIVVTLGFRIEKKFQEFFKFRRQDDAIVISVYSSE